MAVSPSDPASASPPAAPSSSADASAAPPDPQAIVDLLGALAYGELTAFDRLAADARLAPSVSGR
ncbi:MAG: tRNA 2-methylthio-N6-isopentenyl adenosine(37) hydroxylase MiaE-like protein, partial [Actinobacteria bacterium]|nr:tRNA 2-methylthio-N6-isopentenyl adenosine(37) hydroxylase MiaE-like protein [Actinomycetota bacterium]